MPVQFDSLRSVDSRGPRQASARLGSVRRLCPLEVGRIRETHRTARTPRPQIAKRPAQTISHGAVAKVQLLAARQGHGKSIECRLDARSIAAADHDLPGFRPARGCFAARQVAILQRNIYPRPTGGMSSKTEDIEHTEIAVGDLREAYRVLQGE